MRALIITTGSRGDVQPFVALSRALTQSGHEAVIAAPRRFGALVSRHGTEFLPMDEGVLALQDDLTHRGLLTALTSARAVAPLLRAWLDDVARLVGTECDVVVYAPKALGATDLADRIGVPSIAALTVPLYTPTGEFGTPLVPARLPAALRRPSWRLVSAVEGAHRGLVGRWRSGRLGLSGPPAKLAERIASEGALHLWSRHLLSAPADWPSGAAPLGALGLPRESGWTPPESLTRFLSEGEAPVYVGFGSTVARDPDGLTRAVVEGVRLSGRRAILASGWGALSSRPQSSKEVLVVDEVPHDHVFAHVAVAVHHGGAGTVAAALRAGVPQVVRPFVGDQWFWGQRVRAIGVGPAPLTGRLSPESVAAAITRATEHTDRAERLAELVKEEEANAPGDAVRRVLAAASRAS
ncbi:glycosyltransferase [Nocardiopsis sp. CT-R113]|uniref:Glycosyltransferase n=1 Tax=Nocardiopsis codii TaxID=3065942 RepID=A0ABU7K3J1_9ACTN|nr:glycosyltransferase [Nocardiopsis sp. CT-R113]MEE2036798.1 glycosyltransferase [Nocardiopsis sp. CT-R113]